MGVRGRRGLAPRRKRGPLHARSSLTGRSQHPTADVRLIPFGEGHVEAFVQEELRGYAEQQIRDAAWPREGALERSRAELGPVLDRELAAAAEAGDRLWTAIGPGGSPVGWVWVRSIDGEPAAAFLYQITVAETERRRGFGRAMLAALEELLAAEGFAELRLNVFERNKAARRLYGRAGYEQVAQDGARLRLRKRLTP